MKIHVGELAARHARFRAAFLATPRGRFIAWAGRVIAGLALGTLSALVLGFSLGLRVNYTSSLPEGVYFVVRPSQAVLFHKRAVADVHRFDLVTVCLPGRIAAFGRERGYVLPGSCPNGLTPLEKVVVGVPGDTVTLGPKGLIVAPPGRRAVTVPGCGNVLARDPQGARLPNAMGRYRLQRAVWLCGLSVDSWDSRYFGPLPVAVVTGRAYPLFIGASQGTTWQALESWVELFSRPT